ncbi:hypothetical protein ACHAXT_000650 [Thalassiosira profunda]
MSCSSRKKPMLWLQTIASTCAVHSGLATHLAERSVTGRARPSSAAMRVLVTIALFATLQHIKGGLVHSFSAGQSTTLLRDAPSPDILRIGRPSRARAAATTRLPMSSTPFNYGQYIARQDVRLPLLVDIPEEEGGGRRYDVPLPNAHLPPELTTASLYELKLDVPLHRSVINDAISTATASDSPLLDEGCCYGHLVYTPDGAEDLVGSVGCASEILIGAPSVEGNAARDGDDSGPLHVLSRGSFRFRVKEVVKSIPYPIAIVDEVLDDDVQEDVVGSDDEDDDEDGDVYDTLQSKELVQQIFQSLDKILAAQAEETAAPLSPLEKAILEDASSMDQATSRQFDAEERMAVFQAFVSSLLDIAPNRRDRIFAVAMIAGELANLPSELRAKMLVTTDGVERLRMVLRELSTILSMDSAKRITKSLSLGGAGDVTDATSLQEAEDAQKNLQVGVPKLPPWADQIQKGVRIEYYWSEEEGWCAGTVDEDPLKIVDEIVLTIKFDDDGSVHKIPFQADEKARWRPPKGNTGAFD